MNDIYWSIHPTAMNGAIEKISAYQKYLLEKGITDGPAEDAARDGLPIRVSNGLAIIPLMGPMIRRAGRYAAYFGIAGTDSTRLAIQSALADDDVNNILLRIDSPGGSVSGLDQLGDVIAAANKPVTVQVEGMAASAAYYVASQASQIFVGRNDLIGSIGTRMMLYDYSKALEEKGIKAIPIDTGEFKSAGAMGTKITDEQIADFQRIVDFYFDDFVSVVSGGRKISEKKVREIADGRMYTPQQSIEYGLIDGVATLQETLNKIRTPTPGRSTKAARARLRI